MNVPLSVQKSSDISTHNTYFHFYYYFAFTFALCESEVTTHVELFLVQMSTSENSLSTIFVLTYLFINYLII